MGPRADLVFYAYFMRIWFSHACYTTCAHLSSLVNYLLILWKVKVEGKVVSVLFLTEYHAMKTYWGSGCIAPRIL
jgi:hypothetical protein